MVCLYPQPLKMTLRQWKSLCHLLKFTVRDKVGENDPDVFILSPVSSIGRILCNFPQLLLFRKTQVDVFIFLVGKLEGLNQWYCQRCPFLSVTYVHSFWAIPLRAMFCFPFLLFLCIEFKELPIKAIKETEENLWEFHIFHVEQQPDFILVSLHSIQG